MNRDRSCSLLVAYTEIGGKHAIALLYISHSSAAAPVDGENRLNARSITIRSRLFMLAIIDSWKYRAIGVNVALSTRILDKRNDRFLVVFH